MHAPKQIIRKTFFGLCPFPAKREKETERKQNNRE